MSDLVEPKKKSGPWLIGCGLAVLVLLLAAGGFGYYVFRSYTTEAKEVAAIAERIAPGISVPEGYVPAFAIDIFGYRMAVVGPPDLMLDDPGSGGSVRTDRTRFILASAESGVAHRALREMGSGKPGELEDSGVEQLGSETFTVGSVKRVAQKARFEVDGTSQLSYWFDLGRVEGRKSGLVVLGPEKSFDLAAMKAILVGIRSVPAPEPVEETPAGQGAAEQLPGTKEPAEGDAKVPEKPKVP